MRVVPRRGGKDRCAVESRRGGGEKNLPEKGEGFTAVPERKGPYRPKKKKTSRERGARQALRWGLPVGDFSTLRVEISFARIG